MGEYSGLRGEAVLRAVSAKSLTQRSAMTRFDGSKQSRCCATVLPMC
jgi:hypothetical protein